MKAEELIKNIDWSELRNQKRTLLENIDFIENSGIEFENRDINEIAEDLTGILHLLDALQDYAVDELGLDSTSVYDFEMEENRND